MRIFKILLILFPIIFIGAIVYFMSVLLTRENTVNVSYWVHFHIALGFVFAIMSVLYHIKSFRFYRRKEKRRLDKKVRKILWAGTMCFGTFLIYIGSGIIYSLIINITYGYSVNTQDLYTLLVFFIPGFLIFLEASLLKKRIRRLRVAHDVYDEIEHIGNEIEY